MQLSRKCPGCQTRKEIIFTEGKLGIPEIAILIISLSLLSLALAKGPKV